MLINCENCEKTVKKYPYEIKILKNIFCGVTCRVEHNCKKKKNWDFFVTIDTEEKAYWLGFICADGWLCKRDSSIGLGISSKDKEHLSKFAMIFEAHVVRNKDILQVQLYNKLMFLDLIDKGIHVKKSSQNIVKIFKSIPDELMNHFIRGWFDGDGCINIRKNTTVGMFSIVGEKKNLRKIQFKMIDCIPSLKKTKISKKRGKDAHRLRWGGTHQIIDIKRWLYKNATVFLERKKDKFNIVKAVESKGFLK